ncbi:MAG: CBS domain-containing protein, partial [Deltaproteobacteria bacterium]|nr:CBS domain-containing protein [Deltaproteobacteria bacterium]
VRAFLSIHKDHFNYYTSKEVVFDNISRLIVVDANRWDRLEDMNALRDRKGLDIHLWDHHENEGDISAGWRLVRKIGAATSLFVMRFEEEKRSISPIEATLFLAGIYEDTGNLTFPKTTAADARCTGFLLEQKADLGMINTFLRPVYGPDQKDILFEMLKESSRVKINGFNISLTRIEIKGHTPGLALVVEMYQDIVNVDAAFGIFYETERERCIVIGRSRGDSLNIGAIMKAMGGGGHPNAGSAMLKMVNPAQAEEWIIELIQNYRQTDSLVGDLMSSPVHTLSPDITMKEAALLFREKGCTGFPVVSEGELVGVISRRDFKKIKNDDRLSLGVKAFMSTKIITAWPEQSMNHAARLMVKHDVGRLPVVKDGKLIGILTRSDAMRYYYDL